MNGFMTLGENLTGVDTSAVKLDGDDDGDDLLSQIATAAMAGAQLENGSSFSHAQVAYVRFASI